MPSSMPEAAYVEECDSDTSNVKPGTRKEAKRRQTATSSSFAAPPKSISKYRYLTRDGKLQKDGGAGGTSDSGYSSRTNTTGHTSNASQHSNTSNDASTAVPPPPRPSTTQPQPQSSRPRPIVHRSDSHSARPKPPSRSASTSRAPEPCTDPQCADPNCASVRNARRRSGIYAYPVQYTAQYGTSPSQYHPQSAHPYAYAYPQGQPAPVAQAIPILPAPQPRQRSQSGARPVRPVSMYGSYPTAQHGPPPSTSAYQQQLLEQQWAAHNEQRRLLELQKQQQQQQAYQAAYTAALPSSQSAPMFPHPSPTFPSPTSPRFPLPAVNQQTFSARVATNAAPNYDTSNVRYSAPRLARTTSARHPTRAPKMPGSYDAYSSDEYTSESDFTSPSDSEPETRRSHHRKPVRRPSIAKYYVSAPAVPTRSSRPSRRDFASSSENFDSDRTVRAVVDQARPRRTYSNSTRSSRRPSQSTQSSSRTKSTGLSSAPSAGMGSVREVEVERRGGRKISYLSERDQQRYYAGTQRPSRRREDDYEDEDEFDEEELAEELAELKVDDAQRRREAEAHSHQARARGGLDTPDVKMDHIRQATSTRALPSKSNAGKSVASGHSRKTSTRSVGGGGGGVQIESGGTVIHVYGEGRVEVQPAGPDGAARLVVSGMGGRSERAGESESGVRRSDGGRERSYTVSGSQASSKASSERRVGRSRMRAGTETEMETVRGVRGGEEGR